MRITTKNVRQPKEPAPKRPAQPTSSAARDELRISHRGFHEVRVVGKNDDGKQISLNEAKKMTQDNGIDEIYFQDQAGNLHVAYTVGDLDDIREGYRGRFGTEKVKVVHVDDERNTFKEGSTRIFSWTGETLGKALNQEAGKAITTTVSTVTGGIIAAAAVKGGAAATATASAGVGATAATALSGAAGTLVTIGVPVAVVGGAVFGLGSVIGGVRAARRPQNYGTIDMITDQY